MNTFYATTSFSFILVTIFSPIVQLHFLHLKKDSIHNPSVCSEEGLTFRISALETLYSGQFTIYIDNTTLSSYTHLM